MIEKSKVDSLWSQGMRAESQRQSGLLWSSILSFNAVICTLDRSDQPKTHFRRWAYAHRSAAKTSLGDYLGALKDVDAALEKIDADKKSSDYHWAWAQKGEIHRLRARDYFTTGEHYEEFNREVLAAVSAFRRAQELNPSDPWTNAHLAAVGVLALWYYGYEEPDAGDETPAGNAWKALQAELHYNGEDYVTWTRGLFKYVREVGPEYGWALMFEGLFEVLVAGADMAKALGKPGVDTSDLLAQTRNIQASGTDTLEEAIAAGIPRVTGLRTRAVLQMYVVSALHRHITAQRNAGTELLGDAEEMAEVGVEFRKYVLELLDLGQQLLNTDPEDPVAHATTAAALRCWNQQNDEFCNQSGAKGILLDPHAGDHHGERCFVRQVYENSLHALRASRHRLDDVIQFVSDSSKVGSAKSYAAAPRPVSSPVPAKEGEPAVGSGRDLEVGVWRHLWFSQT